MRTHCVCVQADLPGRFDRLSGELRALMERQGPGVPVQQSPAVLLGRPAALVPIGRRERRWCLFKRGLSSFEQMQRFRAQAVLIQRVLRSLHRLKLGREMSGAALDGACWPSWLSAAAVRVGVTTRRWAVVLLRASSGVSAFRGEAT